MMAKQSPMASTNPGIEPAARNWEYRLPALTPAPKQLRHASVAVLGDDGLTLVIFCGQVNAAPNWTVGLIGGRQPRSWQPQAEGSNDIAGLRYIEQLCPFRPFDERL